MSAFELGFEELAIGELDAIYRWHGGLLVLVQAGKAMLSKER
ncbi:MAG: hypothetical protein AAFU73_15615 [Planctomycetota bacterium]